MKNPFLIILTFLILQCGSPNKDDANHKEPIKLQMSNKDKPERVESMETFDSLLQAFNASDSRRLIRKSKGGGGDCYGWAHEFVNDQNQKLVSDKWDCGDYGFERSYYLLSADSLKTVRKLKFEYNLSSDSTPYRLTETLLYFDDGVIRQKSRERFTNNFSDTTFSNSSTFQLSELPKDSLLDISLKEIQAAFVKEDLDD